MATKNIPLTILPVNRPGIISPAIVFLTQTANDDLVIPFRYPFADIENYASLKTAGFFRHSTTTVSSDLGGSASADTEGKLGFKLPHPEKLILLMRVNTDIDTATTDDVTIVIRGSDEYKIPDVTIFLDEKSYGGSAVPAGTLYELDLSNFGLLIGGDKAVSAGGIVIDCDKATIDFALVARMG
jgi:hypothetical protein